MACNISFSSGCGLGHWVCGRADPPCNLSWSYSYTARNQILHPCIKYDRIIIIITQNRQSRDNSWLGCSSLVSFLSFTKWLRKDWLIGFCSSISSYDETRWFDGTVSNNENMRRRRANNIAVLLFRNILSDGARRAHQYWRGNCYLFDKHNLIPSKSSCLPVWGRQLIFLSRKLFFFCKSENTLKGLYFRSVHPLQTAAFTPCEL